MCIRDSDHPMDNFLDFALWRTCRILEPYWLPAFENGTFSKLDANQITFALKAVEKPQALQPLVAMMKANPSNIDSGIVRLVGKIGGVEDLMSLFGVIESGDNELLEVAGLALLEAAQDRALILPQSPKRSSICKKLAQSKRMDSKKAGFRLIGLWKEDGLAQHIENYLSRPQLESAPAALSAAEGLGD